MEHETIEDMPDEDLIPAFYCIKCKGRVCKDEVGKRKEGMKCECINCIQESGE